MAKAQRLVAQSAESPEAASGPEAQGHAWGNAFSAVRLAALRGPVGPDHPSVLGAFSELMGEDLTGVEVRQGSAGPGATGMARGERITVASGTDPLDPEGLALLGHELVHVLQQRKGRVDPEQPAPELEAEAEALGRRAASGRSLSVPAGPLGRTATPQFFRPQDWVRTWLHDDTEVATGLTTREKEVADQLIAEASALVAPWDVARTDPEVDFDPDPLENALRHARRDWITSTGQGFERIESYVVEALRPEGFAQRLREIRSFHLAALVSWGDAFGLGLPERQHVYEIELLEADTGGGGAFCIKGESIQRLYRLTYSNSQLPELTWSTEMWVDLGNMGFDTSVCKPWLTGGSDLPGSISKTPALAKYRPPSWFESCPAGMVSVGASEGVGVVGVEASTLFLGKDSDTLYFESELGLSIKAPVPSEDIAKKGIKSWKDLLPSGSASIAQGMAGVDLAAVDTSWDLGEIEREERPEGPEDWVLVHMAKLFFPTGESELDDRGYETVAELMERMMAYDATHPGAQFLLRIEGGASDRWDSVQRDLDRLVAQYRRGELDEETWQERYQELEASRALNNELLASERAGAVHYALSDALLDMQDARIMEDAIRRSDTGPDTLSPDRLESLGVDENSDYAWDRAVRVSVFYKVG
jgi:hypothetical protein